MLVASLVPLTIALVATAVIVLAASVVIWRRTRSLSGRTSALAEALDGRADALPVQISSARANLAEQAASVEHLLWSLGRADGRLAEATAKMAAQRHAVDDLRGRMERGRDGVEKLKSAVRLIIRAIELRRTILG